MLHPLPQLLYPLWMAGTHRLGSSAEKFNSIHTPLRGVGCTIPFEGNWPLRQDRNSSADVTSLFPPSLTFFKQRINFNSTNNVYNLLWSF